MDMPKIYPTIPEEKKEPSKKKQKDKIPKALREQVWIQTIGNKFTSKCPIKWCKNNITPFDFHVGHNIPEVKGGTLDINNLKALCSRCNLSMNSQYTIDEWQKLTKPKQSCCNVM
jgi:5-methylcytosine-specific restriction endonuclease McrA